jgi:PAS domain S-box-containing protein
MLRNIEERKKAEQALRSSEKQYRDLIELAQEGIWVIDKDSTTIFVNPSMATMLGYTPEEMAGKSLFDFMDEADIKIAKKNIERCQHGIAEQHDFEFLHKDGTRIFTTLETSPIFDEEGQYAGAISGVMNMTARKQAEDELKTSLHEKDILLRELYHRTKNTMQVIRSMLLLQAVRIPKNAAVQKLVADTENRILAMALVHEKLYQSQDLSRIRIQDYVDELAQLIMQSYSCPLHQISLSLDVQPMRVLLDIAIPCGLVLNELLSNALKHAFPGDIQGNISIRLFRNDAGNLELHVADNGVGVPEMFDFRKQDTLGLQTIIALAEHQLRGRVAFTSDHGITCIVEFSDNLYTERV